MNKRRRYTVEDVKNNRFYQLPKFLFEGEFKSLSNDARVLYSLLRDRHDLSISNGWINDKGEVYLIYTRENMAEMLGCSVPTARKSVKALEEYNLIEDERQGLNKPNLIFLNAVIIENTWTEKSFQSKGKESFSQNRKNFSPNETDFNKTDFNDTDKSLHDFENRDSNLHHLESLNDDYIKSYLSIMSEYRLNHKRVNDDNLNHILKEIGFLQEHDIGIKTWEHAIHKHFTYLPKGNDGDITAFLKANKRYFEDCL